MIMVFREVREDSGKRRNRFEIIARILNVAKEGNYKTQIMYGAGLSYTQLSEYLSFLMKVGLLEAAKKDKKLIYKTTVKGIQYLKGYEKIKRLLRKDNQHSLTNFRFAKGIT